MLRAKVLSNCALRLVLSVTAIGLCITTTGCDNFPVEPIAISRDAQGRLIVAVCVSISQASVLGEIRRTDADDWEPFWDVRTPSDFEAGSILESGAPVVRGTTFLPSAPVINPGDAVTVTFGAESPQSSPGMTLALRIPREGLSEGDWLQTNYEITDLPCPVAGSNPTSENSFDRLPVLHRDRA